MADSEQSDEKGEQESLNGVTVTQNIDSDNSGAFSPENSQNPQNCVGEWLNEQLETSGRLRDRARELDETLDKALRLDGRPGFRDFLATLQRISKDGLVIVPLQNFLPAPLSLPLNGDVESFIQIQAMKNVKVNQGRESTKQRKTTARTANLAEIQDRERGEEVLMQQSEWSEKRRSAVFAWCRENCPAPLLWAATVPGSLTQTIRNVFDFSQLISQNLITVQIWNHSILQFQNVSVKNMEWFQRFSEVVERCEKRNLKKGSVNWSKRVSNELPESVRESLCMVMNVAQEGSEKGKSVKIHAETLNKDLLNLAESIYDGTFRSYSDMAAVQK